jgi:hypothetical protein
VNEDEDWLKNYRLPSGAMVSMPAKIRKRKEHFVMVPWTWVEKLNGAHGQTYRLALHLLYLHWREKGAPVKLPNGMLAIDGVSRQSKWRALIDLERRGLIQVERRPSRSPIIRCTLKASHP